MNRTVTAVVALLIGTCALAQNPKTAVFPSAVASDQTLPPLANYYLSSLNGAITSITLTIVVDNATGFITPGTITIDTEHILICSKVSNTLTVCSGGRGYDGSIASAHADKAAVAGYILAGHFNQAFAEIKSIEAKLPSGATAPFLKNESGALAARTSDDSGPAPVKASSLEAVGATTGQLQLSGATSGTVTLSVEDVAGTHTMKLPNAAGATGDCLKRAAGSSMSWGACGGGTGIDKTQLLVQDDFLSGGYEFYKPVGHGVFLQDADSTTGAPAITYLDAEANHPGVLQHGTGTAANNYSNIQTRGKPILGNSTGWEFMAIIRLPDITTVQHVAGLTFVVPRSDNHGMYFWFSTGQAHTNWMVRTCSAWTCSDADTGAVVTAATWYVLRLRMVSAGTLQWAIGAGAWADITSNLPGAQPLFATVSVQTLAAASRTQDVDLMALSIGSITR